MDNIICVSGSPYEQGRTQGERQAAVIAKNVTLVKEKLALDKVDLTRYEAFVARNAAFLQKAHPNLMEEIRGIADGAALPYDDILALNIPAYFMTEFFHQECSMILARRPATADGCTYLIKNRDMGTHIEQAVIRRTMDNGTVLVEVNGAGTVTYPASGMNSDGLAIATTGFWSPKAPPDLEQIDAAHIFVNVRILLEECHTAREVLTRLETYPRMNGLNIIAVDATDAFAIETTRDGMQVQADDGSGILWRTNHYTLAPLTELNPTPDGYPSTHFRHARIGKLLAERAGRVRFQDLFRILSDHENGINAVCRHPAGAVQSRTVSCSMVCLEDGEAWTTIGNPCESLRFCALGSGR